MKDAAILLLLLLLAIAAVGDDRDPRAAIEDTTAHKYATAGEPGTPTCGGTLMPYVGPRVPAPVRMRLT